LKVLIFERNSESDCGGFLPKILIFLTTAHFASRIRNASKGQRVSSKFLRKNEKKIHFCPKGPSLYYVRVF
jgi:hypothetical protein